jgi:superfamily I DNA/RNA helicase
MYQDLMVSTSPRILFELREKNMYKTKSKFYQKSGTPEKFANNILRKLQNPLWLPEFSGNIPHWIKEFQIQLALYKKYQKKKNDNILNRIDFKELIDNCSLYLGLLEKFRVKPKIRSAYEKLLNEIIQVQNKT